MSTITEGGTSPLEAYVAAEEAWRSALQAAVSNHGDWGYVRQAGEIVKQCQAALDKTQDAA